MKSKIAQLGLCLFILGSVFSCKENEREDNSDNLSSEIEAVKHKFAPDKRVALFDVQADKKEDTYILRGESDQPDAISDLKERLDNENIKYVDSIQKLPAESLEGKTHGLVTISVANLRSQPKHSAELATQALLGTPVKILKNEDNWFLIQTPDKYLAWVDHDGIQSFTSEKYEDWKKQPKVIFTELYGTSYSKPDVNSQAVSDLVAGGILEVVEDAGGFYKVAYPDGRVAFVSKEEAVPFNSWLAEANPSQENLIATSKKMMGLPYLWGGTSPKGVDCSGFTKTIYFLNGIVIPRDASQQIHTGELMDDDKDFKDLLPGDLLFFGVKATDTTAERVVHVGMWIGNNEFIHAAGRVKISSVDKNADNFDAYNLNRYLRTKRPLHGTTEGLIKLKDTPLF